jgi:hypothetical protein
MEILIIDVSIAHDRSVHEAYNRKIVKYARFKQWVTDGRVQRIGIGAIIFGSLGLVHVNALGTIKCMIGSQRNSYSIWMLEHCTDHRVHQEDLGC